MSPDLFAHARARTPVPDLADADLALERERCEDEADAARARYGRLPSHVHDPRTAPLLDRAEACRAEAARRAVPHAVTVARLAQEGALAVAGQAMWRKQLAAPHDPVLAERFEAVELDARLRAVRARLREHRAWAQVGGTRVRRTEPFLPLPRSAYCDYPEENLRKWREARAYERRREAADLRAKRARLRDLRARHPDLLP